MEISLFGVNVRIGFAFFCVLTILLCFDFREEIKLALLFSVLHEAGHLTAILCLKQRPKLVSFGLFGMTIVEGSTTDYNYRQELITALSGPAVNLAFAALFLIFYHTFETSAFLKCFAINAAIALFNLMPVFSLDGGRALEALLKAKISPQNADRIMKLVSFVFVVLIDCFGIYVLIKSEYNFTLLIIGIYLTVLIFTKS